MADPAGPGSTLPPKARVTLKALWAVWGGATLVLIGSVLVATLVGPGLLDNSRSTIENPGGRLAVAVGLAAVVALAAWAAYRAGARAFALGLAGGYGVLTLVTAGQCTLFRPTDNGLLGGIAYIAAMVLGFVTLVIATIVNSLQSRKQP
jgi:hypothetical protein